MRCSARFWAAGRGAQQGGARRGADLRYDLDITLEEAFRRHRKARYDCRSVACTDCKGSGAAPGTQAVRMPDV